MANHLPSLYASLVIVPVCFMNKDLLYFFLASLNGGCIFLLIQRLRFLGLDHTSAMSIESTMSTPLPQPETFVEKAKRKLREEPLVTAGTDEQSPVSSY